MNADPMWNVTPHEEPQLSALPAPAPAERADGQFAFWAAERACCCSARPAVVAVLPPGPVRHHATDLLLCGHHYRAARHALDAAGATILDELGQPVAPQDVALLGAR